MFLLVAGSQVTLGIFDLKPGLLFDGRGQRVWIHTHQKQKAVNLHDYRCVKSTFVLSFTLSQLLMQYDILFPIEVNI